MPQTQNAQLRYRTIDKCLHDRTKLYGLIELREACLYALGKCPDEKGLDKRTIQQDLRDLRDYYGVDIEDFYVNRRKYFRYRDPHFSLWCQSISVDEAMTLSKILSLMSKFEGNPVMGWLDELKLHFENFIQVDDQEPIICFESNPDLVNVDILRSLYHLISNHKAAKLLYKPFDGIPSEYIISPYYLKQYNRRWYLWARIGNLPNPYTFAIDRIQSVAETYGTNYIPSNVDFRDYFDDIIGITKYQRQKPQKVLLAISKQRSPFVQTNPIHPFQKQRKNGLDYYTSIYPNYDFFELNVRYNHELYNTILSLGKDCIVLEPLDLKDTIKEILTTTLTNYKH